MRYGKHIYRSSLRPLLLKAAICSTSRRRYRPCRELLGAITLLFSAQMENVESLISIIERLLPRERKSAPCGLQFWSRWRKHGAPQGSFPFLPAFYPLNKLGGAIPHSLLRLRSGTPWPRLLGKPWSGLISGACVLVESPVERMPLELSEEAITDENAKHLSGSDSGQPSFLPFPGHSQCGGSLISRDAFHLIY